MTTRLLVVFVLVLFSGVAFGASPNPSVEERLAILETTMKLQFDALSKQIEANRQSTLKLIELSNDATNKRIDALSKQIEANHQSTLKLIELSNDATNKRIDASNEATNKRIDASNDAMNKRIDTLNNWGIALFAGVLAWIGVFITHALGFWGVSKRDNAVTATTDADRPEASPVMQSADA